MNQLIQALMNDGVVIGENGMPAHENSGSKLLDAFYNLGASRAKSDGDILTFWKEAWKESRLGTLRLAAYNRDIRGGQGERRTFRLFWSWLCKSQPAVAIRYIPHVPFYGRWDDLYLGAFGTNVWENAVAFIAAALKNKDKLCGKWMPREGKKHHKIALSFMQMWGMTPKQYRLLIAGNTDVIETLMCGNRWGEINYNHVPSQAAQKYRKAFYKHDQVRYAAYVAALARGDKNVKVNAGAIFPHEVLHPLWNNGYWNFGKVSKQEEQLVIGQWNALPNFVDEGNFLCMTDTSGSMHGTPIEVSVALSLYLSERCKGPFKDCFITFSNKPKFQYFKGGDVVSRFKSLQSDGWDMNTNFEAALHLILDTAVTNHVPAQDMPNTLLVMSDMQFDQCVRKPSNNALQMIEREYQKAGYKRPNIVFWNLRAATGTPVKYDEQGTALVSGYSPSVMRTVFKGNTPLQVLIETLSQERYERIQL